MPLSDSITPQSVDSRIQELLTCQATTTNQLELEALNKIIKRLETLQKTYQANPSNENHIRFATGSFKLAVKEFNDLNRSSAISQQEKSTVDLSRPPLSTGSILFFPTSQQLFSSTSKRSVDEISTTTPKHNGTLPNRPQKYRQATARRNDSYAQKIVPSQQQRISILQNLISSMKNINYIKAIGEATQILYVAIQQNQHDLTIELARKIYPLLNDIVGYFARLNSICESGQQLLFVDADWQQLLQTCLNHIKLKLQRTEEKFAYLITNQLIPNVSELFPYLLYLKNQLDSIENEANEFGNEAQKQLPNHPSIRENLLSIENLADELFQALNQRVDNSEHVLSQQPSFTPTIVFKY